MTDTIEYSLIAAITGNRNWGVTQKCNLFLSDKVSFGIEIT